MRVVVTGGTGKGGRWVVRDLREHGHHVVNVDLVPDGAPNDLFLLTDLTDEGQVHDVVHGADAVVHFGAIPAPGLRPAGETFRNNTMSTWNIFHAAAAEGVGKVVWASSETVLGLPFDRPPDFAPIDETITPRPESSYSLSKLVGETLAEQTSRQTGIPFLGLRISNIMEPTDYARFPSWQSDPLIRKWNLWGYVDVRDVATAVRAALETDLKGAEICILAAADTVMERDSAELMAEVFPDVPLRRPIKGRETLLAIDRANELIGYQPAHSWLDET
ncbi:MAG TPA: NAD(P)-dependent oxidoreductase [Candidatus Limnocylindrales bacterium]|nr:NAD(P)-dependent oxidoreductase [Candidatus Limnocylindrales bacterium]